MALTAECIADAENIADLSSEKLLFDQELLYGINRSFIDHLKRGAKVFPALMQSLW